MYNTEQSRAFSSVSPNLRILLSHTFAAGKMENNCAPSSQIVCLSYCSVVWLPALNPEIHVTRRLSETSSNHGNGLSTAWFLVPADTALHGFFFITCCRSVRLSQVMAMFIANSWQVVRDLVSQYKSNLLNACFQNRRLLCVSIEVQWTMYCGATPPTADLERWSWGQ